MVTKTEKLLADGRDATKEPPAYLDPRWVLIMRKRLIEFGQTGTLDWYPAKDAKK